MSRIAIIGSGISGMAIARLLHRQYDLTIYEADARPGGHTNTVDVAMDGVTYPVDTGFIVFNRRTYPRFCRMLAGLGVASYESNMSFSVRDDDANLEYQGGQPGGLFAQRRNLLRPRFWRMLRDITRFYREAPSILDDSQGNDYPLAQWLAQRKYSPWFIQQHLVPMAAAIWSAPPQAISNFPARFFVRFLANHGMLQLRDRPQWYTVSGGSRSYLQALIEPFAERIRCNAPVQAVRREDTGVGVYAQGSWQTYDQVVLACHADQALGMLEAPHADEAEVLAAFPYQSNVAVLHSDAKLLPKRRKAWAAWNYHRVAGAENQPVTLTYNLNMLQGHNSPRPLLVSLNPQLQPDADQIIQRMSYAHPLYGPASVAAQQRHMQISGRDRIHYCGAYWGYGFHEDGLASALRVAEALGVAEDWS